MKEIISKKIVFFDAGGKVLKLLFINLAVIFVGTALLGEIYIRFYFPQLHVTPQILKESSMQYEPAIFAKHVFPRREQTTQGNARWNNSIRHINAKGYFGHDFPEKKNAGVTRIIIYGGSAVYDPIFSTQDTWPFRIERLLRDRGLAGVEVINAGVPGHSSHDSFGRFFSEGHHFSPDYVVLYNTWNDTKRFSSKDPLLRTEKPYVADRNPLLNYQNLVDKKLCECSHLYCFLRQKFYQWHLKVDEEGATPLRGNSYEVQQWALDQFRINIEMFVDLARNVNAEPILMTQGRLIVKNNRSEEKLWYAHKLFPHDFIYDSFVQADSIIRLVAKEKRVILVDASKYLTGEESYFMDHVHLSAEGSKELANIFTEHFIALPQIKTKIGEIKNLNNQTQ